MSEIIDEIPLDAPLLTMNGKAENCRVVDVYDGDTITIIFPLGGSYYKHKIRLSGIDTPEIRTKNVLEKKAAIMVREWFKEQILNKIVFVRFDDWDKYGRLMGSVYKEKGEKDYSSSYNQLLIDEGYAYVYDGKNKKKKFDEWWVKDIEESNTNV